MPRRDFAAAYGPWAVVAGGSDGLGAAFAGEIARRGVNLVLVARRPEPLAATAAALRREHGVEVVVVAADLGAPDTVDRIANATSGLDVGLLVLNAAAAPAGRFVERTAEELAAAVAVNCRSSMLLAHRFLPAMLRRGRGGVVVVASLAGMQGVPTLAAYSATKAFLITLGEALWAESRGTGVDVLTACLGAVATPGYQEAARKAAPGTLAPEAAAIRVLRALGRRHRVVPGGLNRVSSFVLGRLVPRRVAVAVFGRASAAALKDGG